MSETVRFPFAIVNSSLGELGQSPYLPLILTYRNRSISISDVLASGDLTVDAN